MTNKKYQIFVSSTYEDLKEERKGVIESILRLRHLPAGMELFSASSDEQFKYIKRVIDDSDYYVLIIKNRYGSTNKKTKKSYTEMEFDYALEKDLPILVFIHKESENKVYDSKNTDFIDFLNKTKTNRIVRYWSNAYELKTEVHMGLSEEFVEKPQQGWQRFEDKTKLLEEINTLRFENQDLKNKIILNTPKIENLADMDETIELHFSYTENSNYGNYKGNSKISATWNDIFSYTAPNLASPIDARMYKYEINNKFINKLASKNYTEIYLDDDDANTIKIQLQAMGLVNIYKANATRGGVGQFIEITDKGLKYLQKIKTIKSKKS